MKAPDVRSMTLEEFDAHIEANWEGDKSKPNEAELDMFCRLLDHLWNKIEGRIGR